MTQTVNKTNKEHNILEGKSTGGGDPLDELIKKYTEGVTPIIVNHHLLRSDYVPNNLPHRTEHIKAVANVLAPVLRSIKPSNLFIYGKTGTGKTAVCRHIFNRFSTTVAEKGVKVRFVYVNCRLAGTEYRILAELCHAAGLNVPFTGISKGELFRRFRDAAARLDASFVVCLDEVDALVKDFGDDLLYELTRSQLSSGWVSLVGISNDLFFKELLDPRVLSSLSEEEVVFQPYSATELRDILWQRASEALRAGSVGEDVINMCAALAAAEHGDARRAIDLLRVAAEVAERESADKVEERHVRKAQTLIERGRVREVVSSLPLHSRLVLLSVYVSAKKSDEVTSGTLYNRYRELCELAGVEALTDRRVSSLVSELDMLGIVACDLVSYGRHGRTRKIKPTIPFDEVMEIIRKDETLSSLLDGFA